MKLLCSTDQDKFTSQECVWYLTQNNFYLRIIEVIVLGGILTAFVLPVFFPGSES